MVSLIILLGYILSCGTRFFDVVRTTGMSSATPPNLVVPPLERPGEGGITSYLAEPPFVAPPRENVRIGNYWMMSQKYSTVSYQTFAAGFSLAVYLLFHLACDRGGLQVGVFRTLGRNALTGYIIGVLIQRPIKHSLRDHFGNDASAWFVAGGFFLLLLYVYSILRVLEWQRIYVKL